jgi:hypothetical protein
LTIQRAKQRGFYQENSVNDTASAKPYQIAVSHLFVVTVHSGEYKPVDETVVTAYMD